MRRLLLCTDMDRTLIPNGKEPEQPGVRALFGRFVAQPGIALAYVTGRHQALVEEAIQRYQLPQPDFVVADVGATLYHVQQGVWRPNQAWQAQLDAVWQGMHAGQIHQLLEDWPGLRLQEPEKQARHKLSYYCGLEEDAPRLIEAIEQHLGAHHIQANLIWSEDVLQQVGLLDILPASASKRHGVMFLLQQLGYGLHETLFAGDSGNDLDVLLSPIPAVLVANADLSVVAAVEGVGAEQLYRAKGSHLQMNGNYAAGILEGVVHFYPEFKALIQALRE
ncbi:HAD-superfamily hydrolase, subfamily IIB [Magnetococcus marinus MC-1]|uniref:HAD-superfamily hydrolase, subfamily IIB n=1 Tax=Magnetococcus marinus (strain ATCC BAA-1437 / JCM 17883 / MC-1) TaxID=156889 RepID=A0LDF7_MAGMM|nr:HAD-IIB family hydrolase [Magnetococcus marinus]ABK46000.1 HAD-superfamily hydrolase, subfamily IIB [Magnetococcus marinus MC-1]